MFAATGNINHYFVYLTSIYFGLKVESSLHNTHLNVCGFGFHLFFHSECGCQKSQENFQISVYDLLERIIREGKIIITCHEGCHILRWLREVKCDEEMSSRGMSDV